MHFGHLVGQRLIHLNHICLALHKVAIDFGMEAWINEDFS